MVLFFIPSTSSPSCINGSIWCKRGGKSLLLKAARGWSRGWCYWQNGRKSENQRTGRNLKPPGKISLCHSLRKFTQLLVKDIQTENPQLPWRIGFSTLPSLLLLLFFFLLLNAKSLPLRFRPFQSYFKTGERIVFPFLFLTFSVFENMCPFVF